ncbi:MAG: HigA family addiction module antitoxin [Vulcanimicrobiaceae bacterium]
MLSDLSKKNRPLTPGEIIREEYLEPLNITQQRLATAMGVSFQRVNELLNGKRGVTVDTALRLGRVFRTSPELWLNVQRAVDLWDAVYGAGSKNIERKTKPLVPRNAA